MNTRTTHLIVIPGGMHTRSLYLPARGTAHLRTAAAAHRRADRAAAVQPCTLHTAQHVWTVEEAHDAAMRRNDPLRRTAARHARNVAWVNRPLHTAQPATAAHSGSQRLTAVERAGLRLLIDARNRERVAAEDAAAARKAAARAGTHSARYDAAQATRADRKKARYLASLTDEQRAYLAALTPEVITEAAAILPEPTGYDAQPYRGMVNAREARVSPRGAAPFADTKRSPRGIAQRVSIRDAHAATQSDEHGLAATTLKWLPTVGYSAHPELTADQRDWLLTQVRLHPTQATYTQRAADGAVTYGCPVTYLTHDEAATATRERARAAMRDAHAERVALLTSVTTHTAADTNG